MSEFYEEEHDPLSDHRIRETLDKDFQDVLNSPQMLAWQGTMQFKNDRNKKIENDLIELLLSRLKTYKHGWITCNMLKTGQLWNKAEMLDEGFRDLKQKKQLAEQALKMGNDFINEIISNLAKHNKIPQEQLTKLREQEIKIRSLV